MVVVSKRNKFGYNATSRFLATSEEGYDIRESTKKISRILRRAGKPAGKGTMTSIFRKKAA